MAKDTAFSTDFDRHVAEHSTLADMVIRRIELAGFAVYLTDHKGVVVCVAHDPSQPRIVVGADKNGNRCVAAIQVARKIGLTPVMA
jgi:hypothetical protein